MRSRWRGALLVLLALTVGAQHLGAQDVNHLYDKFQVSATAAGVILGTTIRIDNDNGEGTEVDTEDDLGLEQVGLRPRLGFRWRPGRRHQLEASYIFINRTGSRSITEDVTIDSVTYTAGATLDSKLGSDQLAVTYRYAIHAGEKSQLGIALGLGATFFDARFTGTGTISGGSGTETGEFTLERKLTGPSASLGGFGQWRLASKWYLEADVRALYVPIDNIKITIIDLGGAFRYFANDWLGFELGGSLTGQKVTIEDVGGDIVNVDFAGKLRYNSGNIRGGAIVAF